MIPIYTVGEICKKCYSCVRECPTKAIVVHDGQADIIEELCISCGHCVTVCSQGAKRVRSSVDDVLNLLTKKDGVPVYAMLAPSFPAAFFDIEPEKIISGLKRLGFDSVYEVAFGADLISYAYYNKFNDLQKQQNGKFIISSPCPAVVSYVEKIFPELLPFLANIVSPMEAMALVIKEKINPDANIVFIGPCTAKKDEAKRLNLVDQVLIFTELNELFEIKKIDPEILKPEDFDPPRANLGRIYPITGGLLKAASIDADLVESPVVVIEGHDRVTDVLTLLSDLNRNGRPVVNKLFDLLLCEGCIAGPAMLNDLTFYERKKYIVQYMKKRTQIENIDVWAQKHRDYLDIDLSKTFTSAKIERRIPSEEEIKKILAMTNKFSPEDELNCKACGYSSCREKAVAVYQGIAEVEMCLPYLISKLECTIDDLKKNQKRLCQAEKLASMGQMAAGIAHEINNPLGVVLMYSHLLKEELEKKDRKNEDADRIIREAERARKIVQGILNFSRQKKIERSLTDINELIQESISGIRSMDEKGLITVECDLDESLESRWVDRNQLRQVFDNILKNAVEVMPRGGKIMVKTEDGDNEFSVVICDTGPGIPEEHLHNLFTPFVTTKPAGKGTGLGLAVCYGIVKMHEGSITAENNPEAGACFTIKIKNYVKEAESVQSTYS